MVKTGDIGRRARGYRVHLFPFSILARCCCHARMLMLSLARLCTFIPAITQLAAQAAVWLVWAQCSCQCGRREGVVGCGWRWWADGARVGDAGVCSIIGSCAGPGWRRVQSRLSHVVISALFMTDCPPPSSPPFSSTSPPSCIFRARPTLATVCLSCCCKKRQATKLCVSAS
jgi:hypothetical protein